MISPDRPALEHENWIAYLTGISGCSGAVDLQRFGGVVALRSNALFDWLNQVLIGRDDATAADLVAAIEPQVHEGDAALIVRLREGVDDYLIRVLERAGWLAAGPETMTPGMTAFVGTSGGGLAQSALVNVTWPCHQRQPLNSLAPW